jgi:large repetitive protein
VLGESLSSGGGTKFVFTRTAGNPDAGSPREIAITTPSLLGSGSQTASVSLTGASLVSGATYSVYILAADIAGNTANSATISGIKFDNVGPAAPAQTLKVLESTLTPAFAWTAPADDSGNGSGVQYYTLSVWSGTGCSATAIRTQSGSSAGITLSQALPTNGADYSWKVTATDNMGNVGTASACDDFTANTLVPALSNASITDTVLSSASIARSGNAISVAATITQSDISHIWLNAAALTGSGSLTAVACSTPPAGMSCSYSSNIATYSFTAGFSSAVTDGVRQAQFTATNSSGGGTGTIIASTTFDSTPPTVNAPFTAPVSSTVWGGTGQTITWNTANVSDSIGISSVGIAYSTGAHTAWTYIGTGSNAGSMAWNVSTLPSGSDYQLRMTVRDTAGNTNSATSDVFSIDKTGPTVPSNTITAPNGNSILKGGTATNITWNAGGITDAGGLATNPIKLEYSLDNGTSWNTIAAVTANDGSESWTVPTANVSTALVRLTATDSAGNTSTDVSDATFVIDSTAPSLSITYAGAGGLTPQNGRYVNNSGIDVSGAGADAYLANVSYTLQNLSSGQYWNNAGTSFTGGAVWNALCTDPTALGTNLSCGSLSSIIVPAGIADGTTYRLVIRAIDEAGNAATANPLDYIGDVTAPAIAISTPDNSYLSGALVIGGTASDGGSGGSSVKIEIKK